MITMTARGGQTGSFRALQTPLSLVTTPTDAFDALRQLLAKNPDVRLAQDLKMVKIDLVDLNSTLASFAPTHLRIVHVIEGLLRTLKQNYPGAKPRRSKALWPVRL